MRVAVLKCEKLPRFVTWEIPDVEDLFTDDRLLLAELERRGAAAESLAWTTSVDWAHYDVAILRSTWDYIDHQERFLKVRLTLRDKGVYDKTVLGLMRRVRCASQPSRAECAAPLE